MTAFSVQAGNLPLLREALRTGCSEIRFGSEFCMYNLPTERALIEAFRLTEDAGKEFAYVTPRVSDDALNKLKGHFKTLGKLGGIEVVVNDLGTLSYLGGFRKLKPRLGRQLVYTPARCPWPQITEHSASIFVKYKVKRIYYRTALNYDPTIQFYKEMGVNSADVDWIPQSFKNYHELVDRGFDISVYLHLIPAALTRKCHTARLLGETDLNSCSRPCYSKAFEMENESLKRELFLQGNGVFRIVEPTRKDADRLRKIGVSKLILTMKPVTGIETSKDIESIIERLGS